MAMHSFAGGLPRNTSAVCASFLCLGLVLGALGEASPASPGTVVLASVAGHRCFAATIGVTGSVVPKAIAIAAVESPNMRLDQLFVKEGDNVTSGQKLARLVRLSPNAPMERASPSIPPERANASPAESFLYAPAAGRVFKVSATVGETLSDQTEPLIQIAIKDEFEVQAQIPAAQISKLQSGQVARVDFGAGQDMIGALRRPPREVNRITQLGEARISLEGSEHPPPGTFAHVSIDAQRRCGVAIPRSAILEQSEFTTIQVIRDNAVTARQIRLGLLSEDAAEVVEGLFEGEIVVAHAGTSLHNGDRVAPSIINPRP